MMLDIYQQVLKMVRVFLICILHVPASQTNKTGTPLMITLAQITIELLLCTPTQGYLPMQCQRESQTEAMVPSSGL